MDHRLAHLSTSDTPLAIIGLGYVGLPLAVEFGKQRPVIGFDIDPERIAELRAGHDRTRETTPEELAAACHLSCTDDLESLRQCRIFIVTVPTPVDDFKRPDLTPLIKASATVGKVLKPGDLVIYESTVYPGCTEEDCVPVLEQHSGLSYRGGPQDLHWRPTAMTRARAPASTAATARSASIPAIASIVSPRSRRSPAAPPPRSPPSSMRSIRRSSAPGPIEPAAFASPRPPRSSRTPSATSTSRS